MAKNDRLARIIAGCKDGCNESFSRLVDIYAHRCYGYFYRLTGNRQVSDDLLGRLFVKVVEKIASFKDGSFDCWLFKAASNVFYDYLRDKYRQQDLIEGYKKRLAVQSKDIKSSDSEVLDKLQDRLGRLDDDTRELILMRFYSQVSFKEIAQMRSEPIGTTLSKVHRGLKKLRELMEQ